MQYLRHIHTKILFMAYLKFNQLISCILFDNFSLNLMRSSKLFILNSIFFICFKNMDNHKAPLPLGSVYTFSESRTGNWHSDLPPRLLQHMAIRHKIEKRK